MDFHLWSHNPSPRNWSGRLHNRNVRCRSTRSFIAMLWVAARYWQQLNLNIRSMKGVVARLFLDRRKQMFTCQKGKWLYPTLAWWANGLIGVVTNRKEHGEHTGSWINQKPTQNGWWLTRLHLWGSLYSLLLAGVSLSPAVGIAYMTLAV